jgi:hypothetical protein
MRSKGLKHHGDGPINSCIFFGCLFFCCLFFSCYQSRTAIFYSVLYRIGSTV